MPAIAPGLRPERGVAAAAAALVVDAGAAAGEAVGEAVGDALGDEELVLVPPGGTDSSGNFYSCQLDPSFHRHEDRLYLAWLQHERRLLSTFSLDLQAGRSIRIDHSDHAIIDA